MSAIAADGMSLSESSMAPETVNDRDYDNHGASGTSSPDDEMRGVLCNTCQVGRAPNQYTACDDCMKKLAERNAGNFAPGPTQILEIGGITEIGAGTNKWEPAYPEHNDYQPST